MPDHVTVVLPVSIPIGLETDVPFDREKLINDPEYAEEIKALIIDRAREVIASIVNEGRFIQQLVITESTIQEIID